MRGKVAAISMPYRKHRITPAYAGKSAKMLHPIGHFRGSPPPMRGKGNIFRICCHINRITPAYAGKSLVVKSKVLVPRDHPRLCGEKPPRGSLVFWLRGSPPPMRGKEPRQSRGVPDYRITPAYAGKSVNSGHFLTCS